jgi:drug/metabolite transporter (DMT)-like permease
MIAGGDLCERGQDRTAVRDGAGLAGTFFGLDITFWHASLVMTSVANATFLVNLGNAAVGLIAWIALGERPSRKSGYFALCAAHCSALSSSRKAQPLAMKLRWLAMLLARWRR